MSTLTKKRGAVVGVAAAAAVAVALPAWAFWTLSSNSDDATVTARALSAPTAATATVVSATSVTVSWSNPAAQLPGAEYTVTNTADGHTVCTVTTTSCSDTAAVPGVLNTYAVKAVLPSTSWASAAASPAATPPPVFAVTNASGMAIGTQTAGTAFSVKVTVMKGSPLAPDTSVNDTRSLTFAGPAAGPKGTAPTVNGVSVGTASNIAFSGGSATVPATLYAKATSVTISATQGTGPSAVTGTSAAFAVNAGARSALMFTSSNVSCASGSVNVARNTNGVFVSKVSVTDAWGNALANGATAVTVTNTVTTHTIASGASLTVAAGANPAESSGSVTVNSASGAGKTGVLTAAASGLTSATCTLVGA